MTRTEGGVSARPGMLMVVAARVCVVLHQGPAIRMAAMALMTRMEDLEFAPVVTLLDALALVSARMGMARVTKTVVRARTTAVRQEISMAVHAERNVALYL